MPSELPYVRCPFCWRSFAAASNTSASNPQPENGVRASAPPLPVLVLRSWKEIACYVGAGVRTAQRWEHDLGLPVRRQGDRPRTSVMAFPEELETWLHRAPTAVLNRNDLATAVHQKHCA